MNKEIWERQQAYFDKTVTHLLKQGKQASIEAAGHVACKYRTGEGLSCAMGCHIPDAMYHPFMEGRDIYALIDEYPELQPLFPDVELAKMLQLVHDSRQNWGVDGLNERGREYLHFVARGFDLSTETIRS